MTAIRSIRQVLALGSVVIWGCAVSNATTTKPTEAKSAEPEPLPQNLPPNTAHTAKLGEPCLQAFSESSCEEPLSCSGMPETKGKGICFASQKIGEHCDGSRYRCPVFTQECPPHHNRAGCVKEVCACTDRGDQ